MSDRERTFAAAAALAFLLGAGATAARAAGTVAGVIVSLEGHPSLRASGKDGFKRVKVNDLVREGDTLKTGHGERVGVAFTGGAELRVNEDSQFTVQAGGSGDKAASVFTALGDAWTRLVSGHGGPGIELRSPVAVAAVRGTEADVDVSDRMTVKVYDGLVDVMNDKGKTPLRAGQQASAAAGAAPGAASRMSPRDYRTWQNGLKPADLDKSLKILNKAADRDRTLEMHMKDKNGADKKVKLHFEKK